MTTTESTIISQRDTISPATGGTVTDSGSRIIPWVWETEIDPVVTTEDQWIWCDGDDQFIQAGSTIRIVETFEVENSFPSQWETTRWKWEVQTPPSR